MTRKKTLRRADSKKRVMKTKKSKSASKPANKSKIFLQKKKVAKKPLDKTTGNVHTKQDLGGVEFCSKCGAIMLPVKKEGHVHLKCRSCGSQKRKNVKSIKIVEEIHNSKGVVVLEKDETILPKTNKLCEKCGNKYAFWWMQQTREADEPPTQFFRCTKCKFVWREYK